MAHHGAKRDRVGLEPSASMAELRGDCARMAGRWVPRKKPSEGPPPVGPPRIHGITVPPGSVRLIVGMSDYGD
jgi:hypothetical protein